MEICHTANCTGCMACMNSCPYDAIQEKHLSGMRPGEIAKELGISTRTVYRYIRDIK